MAFNQADVFQKGFGEITKFTSFKKDVNFVIYGNA